MINHQKHYLASQLRDHGEEKHHNDKSGADDSDDRDAMLDELEKQMFERARMDYLSR